MWWKWTIFIVLALMALICNLATAVEWAQGKTGPFGPNLSSWWGCAFFTLVCAAPMIWIGFYIF